MSRQIKCPYCSENVLAKNAGRMFSSISGFLQRSFNIRIPTGLLNYLKENTPVSKKSILKKPCEACDGKGTIEDPSDDTEKFQAVKANAEAKMKEILELENELAPACGNRYTIIQGCDLLEVGLGFNDAPAYRVDKDKSVRSYGLVDPGDTNPKKGGPQIPKGAKLNHVQGINSLASPGGHYMIKCANKFTLLAGAQGIDITTGGPLTIGGGITKITSPEISIGTSSGRLLLEGQAVNINGKSVEVAPSDGHFFVKGTISNTGNVIVGGHSHMESASVTKLETTGKNEKSKPSSPSDLYDGPAFWGGMGVEAIQKCLIDTVGLVTSRLSDPVEAQQMLSPRYFEDMRDKMLNMTYNVRPWELKPTGVILPQNCVVVGVCSYGGSVVAYNPMLVPIYNFPHCHAVPNLSHNHETRIPDIDCSADSAEELRGKQSGVGAPAPLHKTSTNFITAATSLFQPIATVFVGTWKGIQGKSGPFFK